MFKLSALTIAAALSSVSAFANCPELTGNYIQCEAKEQGVTVDFDYANLYQFADAHGTVTYTIQTINKSTGIVETIITADGKTTSVTAPDGTVTTAKAFCGQNELAIEESITPPGQGTTMVLTTLTTSAAGDLEIYLNMHDTSQRGPLVAGCKLKI